MKTGKNKFPLKINGIILYDQPEDYIRINNISKHVYGLITDTVSEEVENKGEPVKKYTELYHMKIIQKYPEVAALTMKLLFIYINNNVDPEYLHELLISCVEDHPDFLYARTYLAEHYIKKEEVEKAIDVFGVGKDITIKKVYPKRTAYMKGEYLHFCSVLIFIHILKINFYNAIIDVENKETEQKKALKILAEMIFIEEYNPITVKMAKCLKVSNLQHN